MNKKAEPKTPKIIVETVQSVREKLKQPREYCLPSGMIVQLRRLTPMDYIQKGFKDVPNEFFKFVAELSQGLADPNAKDADENFKLYEKFLNITINEGVVNPPVITTYDEAKTESHVLLGEFSQADQKYMIDVISGKIDG